MRGEGRRKRPPDMSPQGRSLSHSQYRKQYRTQVDFRATLSAGCRQQDVSLPREVLPGCTYMITRRCSERRLLLRPDHETNNAFLVCLAVAAQRFGIQVIFTYAAANHQHTPNKSLAPARPRTCPAAQ